MPRALQYPMTDPHLLLTLAPEGRSLGWLRRGRRKEQLFPTSSDFTFLSAGSGTQETTFKGLSHWLGSKTQGPQLLQNLSDVRGGTDGQQREEEEECAETAILCCTAASTARSQENSLRALLSSTSLGHQCRAGPRDAGDAGMQQVQGCSAQHPAACTPNSAQSHPATLQAAQLQPAQHIPAEVTWLARLLHRGDFVAWALCHNFHGVVCLLAGPTRRQLLRDHCVWI